jgi:hypothetical protein
LAPFVEEAYYYFLKTIILSRKATRDYLRGRTNEKEMNKTYEEGKLISTDPSKAELEKFRSAAQLVVIKGDL